MRAYPQPPSRRRPAPPTFCRVAERSDDLTIQLDRLHALDVDLLLREVSDTREERRQALHGGVALDIELMLRGSVTR